jgi:tetratricopeptide (TPR) repeat protein
MCPRDNLVRRIVYVLALCTGLFCARPSQAAQPAKPKWIRVSSDHFSVLTDAGEKNGHEVAVRLEQMRGVFGQLLLRRKLNMSEPLEIIALRGDKEYADIAPIRPGQEPAPGFFISGLDRNCIVLNLSEPQSWLAVSHEFAHYFLNYNYPPTQPWFDEGFAEYFSSVHMDDKQAGIGGDPELGAAWDEDLVGNQIQKRNPPRSLTELLTAPVWLSVPDLFAMHEYSSGYQEGTHHTLFYAQSWMVVHYLLSKNKLAETGTYFDLVQNQKVSIPQAIQQAYGVSVAQFDQAVKDYFKSLTPLFLALDASKQPDTKAFDLNSPVYQVSHPATVDAEDIGTSTAEVPDAEAQASVAEMALRLPEHRQQSVAELKGIGDEPKMESAIAHRALAWAYMQKKDFVAANAELGQASQIDPKDPWVHYYLAVMKYQQAQLSGGSIPGLPNMMQDLRTVLDWNPDFAEAYNMLAMARLAGGGTHSAMDAIRPAIQLSPRDEMYLLNLARIDIGVKKWDDATGLLNRLKASANPQIAHAAQKDLQDLPTLKKYGLLPQDAAAAKPMDQASRSQAVYSSQDSGQSEDSESESESESTPRPAADIQPDKRPVKFLKGTLLSVDCSHPPAAVLTLSSAGKTLKLRTPDYKALVLIGADEFSCEWERKTVTVNFKASGKTDGDLVSLELQ